MKALRITTALVVGVMLTALLALPASAHPAEEPDCADETHAVVSGEFDWAMATNYVAWKLKTDCVVGPDDTDALDAHKVYVVGGTEAVPESALAGLNVVERLWGADRIATARAVLDWVESYNGEEEPGTEQTSDQCSKTIPHNKTVRVGTTAGTVCAGTYQVDCPGATRRLWQRFDSPGGLWGHFRTYEENDKFLFAIDPRDFKVMFECRGISDTPTATWTSDTAPLPYLSGDSCLKASAGCALSSPNYVKESKALLVGYHIAEGRWNLPKASAGSDGDSWAAILKSSGEIKSGDKASWHDLNPRNSSGERYRIAQVKSYSDQTYLCGNEGPKVLSVKNGDILVWSKTDFSC